MTKKNRKNIKTRKNNAGANRKEIKENNNNKRKS